MTPLATRQLQQVSVGGSSQEVAARTHNTALMSVRQTDGQTDRHRAEQAAAAVIPQSKPVMCDASACQNNHVHLTPVMRDYTHHTIITSVTSRTHDVISADDNSRQIFKAVCVIFYTQTAIISFPKCDVLYFSDLRYRGIC